MLFGTRTLRATAAATLFFFAWMTLHPALAAAVQSAPPPVLSASAENPLDDLRDAARRGRDKAGRGEAHDVEDRRLIERGDGLDAEERAAEAGFAEVARHLQDHRLPVALQQRHAQAVADYRAKMAALKGKLRAFRDAHDHRDAADERRTRADLADFLEKHQKARPRPPFDPRHLPFRAPGEQVRAPKEKKEELDPLIQPAQPVKVAATDLAPGLLAVAEPGATPTPEDVAETEDAPLTPSVRARAEALHRNPVEIFNFVRNGIEFLPTYGSIQGADLTLQTKRGNAFDTASLLVALLRASGIPARYVYGTIQAPAEPVMNWVGGVKTPEAAQSLLSQGGVPNTMLISGGKVAAFRLEHVWVEAFVDYVPSRGAVNRVGDTWVPLDASFKARSDLGGVDLAAAVPLNAQAAIDAAIDAAKGAATCDADTAQGLDAAPLADAFADYRLRLDRYLATLGPDPALSDLLGVHGIAPVRHPILLGTPPYTVVARAAATPALADSARWRLRYAVYASELDRSQDRPVVALSRSLPALAGRRITLSFAPATAADAAALDSYLPQPRADGAPLQADDFPAGLPGYLIQVRAELRVDGQVVASGGAFPLGQPLSATLAHFDPAGGAWSSAPHELNAGEYHALAIDGQGVAVAPLDTLRQNLGATLDALSQGRFDGLDRDGVVGAFLHQTALAYLALTDAHDALVARATGTLDMPLPSYGRAALRIEPDWLFGIVREARFLGAALRLDSRGHALAVRNPAIDAPGYRRQAQQRASAHAHQLLQRLLTDAQRPGAALSAVKAIATAARLGAPVLSLATDNAAQQLARITLDDDAKQDLSDAVAAGFGALAQRDPLALDGYDGGGYRLDDPRTGAGDYRLSTHLAGGATGLLIGPAGLGHLALASPAQAAGNLVPALATVRELDGHLAALLGDAAGDGRTRWSTHPAQGEVVSALFLARFAGLPARDACDHAASVLAADVAVTAGLPSAGTPVNHPPRIASVPPTDGTANQPYRYQAMATDDDGDALSYRLLEGPAGATLDAAGLLAWATPVAGSYPVRLRVDDGRAYAEQAYTLAVGDALAQPDPRIEITPAIANPGESILIAVTVLGGGTPTVELTVDGAPKPLDANGQARLEAPPSGTHQVVVSVASGDTVVRKESQYTVRDPSDTVAPTAALSGPAQDATVTAPVEIRGTTVDDHFAYYQIVIRPAGDPDTAWQELSRSYAPVASGVLGRLDPATLPNGLYDLGLRVVDVNGRASLATTPIEILGGLKLGPFRVAFEDLSVDAAGIPVRVTRGYDSLRRHEGLDFGWGWSVDYQTVSIRKNMALGLAWEVYRPPASLTLCLRPAGVRKVAVTLPDGQVQRFTAANAQECAFFQVPDLDIRFTPQPGTTATLALVDDGTLVQVQGGLLMNMDTGEAWNPARYKLTTEDGYIYYLKEGVGIEQIKDPHGNTLTYGPDGIVHSAGLGVAFERDAKGRITKITDPQGQAIRYAYTSQGDLASMTDRAGQTSTFAYAPGHLLTDYTDPRGVKAARQVYDDQGRLVALIDADGHRTGLAFEADAHRQVVADRLGNKTAYLYDDRGNVTTKTDPLGNVTQYAYDALDNETAVTDPLGHILQKTFDPQSGKVLTETDPLGHVTRYAYSADKTQLTGVTDPLGRATGYVYVRGQPWSIDEPLGRTTRLRYDGQGNLASLGLAGQTTRYGYNAQGQKTAETDPAGHTVQYTLDANGRETGRTWTRTQADGTVKTYATSRKLDAEGRVLEETDATGAVTKHEYNGAGKVTQETDPLGRVTRFEYDAQARLVKTTHPDGATEATAYDANGNPVSETDRAGRTTRHAYDALNRLIQTTHPDGTATQTVYDAAGRVWKSVAADGGTTEHAHDAAGRLTAATGPDGQAIRHEYDAAGNRTQTTGPDGQITRFEYDALNRLVKTTHPDGTTSQTAWRLDGLKQSETDPAGRVRDYGYDAAGRLALVKESLGTETTVYAYDEAGNKTRQTDAEGRVTRWEYDAANRPTARVLPHGERETFQYDLVGRLAAHTGFDGGVTRHGYDAADRPSQLTLPDGQSTAWTYTADGQIATLTDALGTTRYTYDAQGRKVREVRPDGAALAWTHDADGQITARSAPGGTTRYQYDAAGRLARLTDPQGKATTYTHDAAGRLLTQTYPNGAKATHAYDANGRRVQLVHTRPDGTVLTGVAYGLAANGQRTERREFDAQSTLADGQAQNPSQTTRYQYDGGGRLAREADADRAGTITRTTTYAYDKVGNRVQKTLTTAAGTETTLYSYDADDRLTREVATLDGQARTTDYAWDANGRLTQKAEPGQVTLYGWDGQDHLIEVKRGPTAATAQTVATYGYDAQGNRVKKTEKTAQGDKVTAYLIDDTFAYAQVVEEKTKLGGQTQTARYVWGEGLVATTEGGQARYVHADGLGSVAALSDAAGAVTDTYGYDAFGNALGRTGSSGQPYRFAGEHFDAAAGMQYHRARWYAPEVGRFASLDPFAGNPNRPGTLNKYVYANADPGSKRDPSGRTTLAEVNAVMAMVFTTGIVIAVMQNNNSGGNDTPSPPSTDVDTQGTPPDGCDTDARLCGELFGGIKWDNWKSKKAYGHTFTDHGSHHTVSRMADRAVGLNQPQGQWLNNARAAELIKDVALSGRVAPGRAFDFQIPSGVGRVILENGEIVQTTWARIVLNRNGLVRTAFPILPPSPLP